MSKITINHEPKRQGVSPDDGKKPTNRPANTLPKDGFVLQVDGKFKTQYESSEEAVAAGTKLKQSFPVIQIAIYDAAKRIYTPLGSRGPSGDPAAASDVE